MNQFHYDFIRERNDKVLHSILLENEIQELKSGRYNLRVRFLFLVSDFLLGLGARIRPDEIRVFVHDYSLDDCSPSTN